MYKLTTLLTAIILLCPALAFAQGGGGRSHNYVVYDAVQWGSDCDAQAFDLDGSDLDISAGTGTYSSTGTLSVGAITGTSYIIGANTLDTNEWAFLDGLDQALKVADSVQFAGITGTSFVIGANTLDTNEWAFLDGLDQALKVADSVQFASITDGTATLTGGAWSGLTSVVVDNLTLDGGTITSSGILSLRPVGSVNLLTGVTIVMGESWIEENASDNIEIYSEGGAVEISTLDIEGARISDSTESIHFWENGVSAGVVTINGADGLVVSNSESPSITLNNTGASTYEIAHDDGGDSIHLLGGGNRLGFRGAGGAQNEDILIDFNSAVNTVKLTSTTGATTVDWDVFGHLITSGGVQMDGDNLKLQLGDTLTDLEIYSDGTDGVIDTNGDLKINPTGGDVVLPDNAKISRGANDYIQLNSFNLIGIRGSSAIADMMSIGSVDLRFAGATSGTSGKGVCLGAYNGSAWADVLRVENTAAGNRKMSVANADSYFGDGGTTNYSTFEVDGTIEFNGTATVWDDLRVSALALKISASKPPGFSQFADDGAAGTGVFTYMFDDSNEEQVFFTAQMPHGYKEGSDLKAHVHWSPQTADTGQVNWYLEYTIANTNGTFGDTATITMSDDGDGAINKHQFTASTTISGTNMTISHMLVCRLYRDGGVGTDDLVGDAALLEFDIHYEIDTVGSRTELGK